MTNLPDERPAAIAEVLTEHEWFTPRGYAWPCCDCGEEFPDGEEAARAHVADALAPMLAGWLAEERRDLAAKVEALADSWAAIPPYTASNYDLGRVEQREMCETELRTLLADALPQEGDSEPASVPTNAREGGNGQGHAGEGERGAEGRTEAQEGCEHQWMTRGHLGDEWRECFLCGKQEDV